MQIIWKGQSCFQILSGSPKNGEVKLVIDPYDEKIGFKLPKMEADILLVTHDHPDHNNVKGVSGAPFLVTGPGEYDIKGVFVQGISAFHDKVQGKERGKTTCYIIECEDRIRLLHLGDLGQTELTDEQVDFIGDIDILMIPVGGDGKTIDGQEAAKIISQIEPKIVIPMHYHIPKSTLKLDDVQVFLKKMGVKEAVRQSKLTIKKKDLPEEETQVIVLEP